MPQPAQLPSTGAHRSTSARGFWGESATALKDTISSVVVLAFSLLAFVLAKNFGGGSEIFPRGIAVIMMLASASILVRALVWPRAIPEGMARMDRIEAERIGICVVLTLAFVALLVPLGFVLASVAFIVAISYVLGLRSHLTIWLTAFGFVGVLYFLFVRVFHTPLPSGILSFLPF